jgi:beta-lactamase regulating signal transducer with metallopeptidase domain
MTQLDRLSIVWAHYAWSDAWQGALLAAAVWLLCRLWPGMPARGRAWLWWLVSVKFILGFIPMSGIPLPILPAHSTQISLSAMHIPARLAVGNGVHVECATSACASYMGSPAFTQCIHMVGLMLRMAILGLWIYGIIVNFVKMAHGWWHARELRARSTVVQHRAISFECRRLCFFVGIKPPMLLESDELTSPILTGFVSPAIILPSDIIMDCKVHDARMMLAHELAHLKRRDLLFGWIPALSQILNWWNPLIWLMAREWGTAQEIACDQFALETTAALPVHFGQMLLAMAVASRRPQAVGVAAVGLTGEHQTLKRRLIGMRYTGLWKRPGVNLTMRTVLIAVGLFLVPWHPVPRDEFRVPQFHSRTAQIVWQGIETVAHVCNAGVTRLAALIASSHPMATVRGAALPQQAAPAMLKVDNRAVADPNGADRNVPPSAVVSSVKTVFTPVSTSSVSQTF